MIVMPTIPMVMEALMMDQIQNFNTLQVLLAPLCSQAIVDRKQKGYTLIELVMVISLLGLVAIAVVTISPSPNTSRLQAAAREVQSTIEMAKNYAMTTRTTHGVDFVASGALTVYQSTTATPIANPLDKQDWILTLSNRYPNISIQSNYTVEFNSLGSPTTGGGGSVVLTDGTNTKTIAVTANTGKVNVQ